MYTSNLSVEKIRSRLSFELNKLVFRLFSLILLSDNEIDFYFCTPFTTIWLHSAWALLLIQYTAKKVITLTVCNCLNCKIGGHKVGFSSKMQGKNIFKDLDGCLKWNVNHQSTAADIHRPFLQIAINTRPTSVFVALHGLKSFAVDWCCTSNCLVCELLQRTHFK